MHEVACRWGGLQQALVAMDVRFINAVSWNVGDTCLACPLPLQRQVTAGAKKHARVLALTHICHHISSFVAVLLLTSAIDRQVV
jgi:hypothetical protein